MMDNYISFSDDKISPNRHGSTKALHITIKVKDCTLPKFLINNGSSLNVMTLSTLMRLLLDRSYMKHTKTMVRAFDGIRSKVIKKSKPRAEEGQSINSSRILNLMWKKKGILPQGLVQKKRVTRSPRTLGLVW